MRALLAPRRRSGVSIAEMTVATSIVVGILGLAIPAFVSVTRAGDEGQARATVDGDNRQALLRIARELMNTTLDRNAAGVQEWFAVADGDAPVLLAEREGRTQGAAPSRTQVGTFDVADPDSGTQASTADLNASNAAGSGKLGGTATGRTRATGTADFVGADAMRPRNQSAARNSVLTFRRVTGYTVGSGGSFTMNWTTPIEYRVRGRDLVRTQDGVERVVSPNCSRFRVETTPHGTIVVTLGTQRRATSTGRVAEQLNQIEIEPKN